MLYFQNIYVFGRRFLPHYSITHAVIFSPSLQVFLYVFLWKRLSHHNACNPWSAFFPASLEDDLIPAFSVQQFQSQHSWILVPSADQLSSWDPSLLNHQLKGLSHIYSFMSIFENQLCSRHSLGYWQHNQEHRLWCLPSWNQYLLSCYVPDAALGFGRQSIVF